MFNLECPFKSLQGIETLQKHLETHDEGSSSCSISSMTWLPISWHQSLANAPGSATDLNKSNSFATPHIPKVNLGAVFVKVQKPQMAEFKREMREQLLVNPPICQTQNLVDSQSWSRSRKRWVKQLRVKKIKRNNEDDNEGTTNVTLDDFTRFVSDQQPKFLDQRQSTLVGVRRQEGCRDIQMVVGQAMKVLRVDLSRPQPMQKSTQDGSESAKAPRCITFGVMQKKIDNLNLVGIDTDLLHDPSL